MATDNEHEIQVPVVWAGVEDVPILYANTFVSQLDAAASGAFIITVGQLTPPALIGTPEEVREQAEQVSYVPVRPIFRIGLTRAKIDELIAVLQANRDQYDEASKMRQDPRNDD